MRKLWLVIACLSINIFIHLAILFPVALADNTKPGSVTVMYIAPFEDNTGDEKWAGLATGFSDLLTASFLEHKDIQVVERQQVGELIKEQEISLQALSEAGNAARAGKLIGADFIIVGGLLAANEKLTVVAHILDVNTARIIVSKKVSGSQKDILSLSLQLASELAQSINIKLEIVSAEDYDETSMVSLHFMRGLGFYYAGNFDRAIMEFMSCGDIDPNHAASRYWIGRCYYNLEEFEHAGIELQQFLKDFPESTYIFDARELMDICLVNAKTDSFNTSEIKISNKRKPVSLFQQKEWVLAATAIIAERSNLRHDLLGGSESTSQNIKRWKTFLRMKWKITDRESLYRVLQEIKDKGDRKNFNHFGSWASQKTAKELEKFFTERKSTEKFKRKSNVSKKHYDMLGSKSILGWDYACYISLCRWGYLVGYISSEEEAWYEIMPVARLLQRNFDSWADLGQNYLIGLEFMSSSRTEQYIPVYREVYQKLLTDPKSSWNVLSWNMELDNKY
ncbi:DUF1266 domain-containing protein [bacterium]|nr:DUF1266 domain-containing protein [bacterium]